MKKTNVMRLLDAAEITYRTVEYAFDEASFSGVQVAELTGEDPDQAFKTLVVKGDKNGFNVFCIPVGDELDLRKAASVSGNKKVEMVHVKDLLKVTGYMRGECSPIGMKKHFPTFIDETCTLFSEVIISGGKKGTQVILSPEDLIAYTGASLYEG